MERATAPDVPFDRNPAAVYAAVRNLLYEQGRKIEILGSYEPKLQYVSEWWKQLYGESEGKEGKGIFPASVTYTADLHSMGQYIQQGERTLFETIVSVDEPQRRLTLGAEAKDLDGLNFLAGRRLSDIGRMAEPGVRIAHLDGDVPNLRIVLERIDAYQWGPCSTSSRKPAASAATCSGVNPFDQPGVEDYKRNMFAPWANPATRRLRKRSARGSLTVSGTKYAYSAHV